MLPPLVLTWGETVLFGPHLPEAQLAATALFLTFVSAIVLSDVMRTRRVSFDTISGGLAVYLIIGLIFTEIYALLLTRNPGCIEFPTGENPSSLATIAYFSFVTLTTLGYGDILPLSPGARALVSLEAVTGQVYLTVLVARLVGLHISQSGRLSHD